MKRKLINIKIKHSIKFEIKRVFNIVQKIDWFNRMAYEVDLPEDFKLENPKNVTKKTIADAITHEYDSYEYKKTAKAINKNWNRISRELAENFKSEKLEPKLSYSIILTKYGTGGSYDLPNHIIINFRRRSADDLIRIIIHEMIHLLIEPLIKKYHIEHWQKERVVDLMFPKISPANSRMQKIPVNTKKIDETFNNFFPDVDKILKNIRK